jgi:hypothetical protein
MNHQLYMYSAVKRHFIERHDFYVAQVKKRLFSQFLDIEEEAETRANETYNSIGRYASEYDDPADYAEAAHEAGVDHYIMLSDLHNQVILGALAGMYHQWDKELRQFLASELRYTCPPETEKSVWNSNIGEVFDLLKHFGWDCRNATFFPGLDAGRLIVNIYKHGNGKALEDLSKKYPEYLFGYDTEQNSLPYRLDHELLTISEDQFGQLADSVRLFWETFPERSFYGGEETEK